MGVVDDLVAQCIAARDEDDPRRAVKEVVAQAVADGRLAQELGEPAAGLNVLYNTEALTVLNVVWPPLMSLFPHDHRMWAAIGIYAGREDNRFFRRQGRTIVPSGGRRLDGGEVVLLGDDTVHAVDNPTRSYTGAIHVYGGDFIGMPRSQWDPGSLAEEPYDLAAARRAFVEAEQRFLTGPTTPPSPA